MIVSMLGTMKNYWRIKADATMSMTKSLFYRMYLNYTLLFYIASFFSGSEVILDFNIRFISCSTDILDFIARVMADSSLSTSKL
jgi:hypothetical protein